MAYRDADVFLLCYKISDPTTLFSALNYWCPEIRMHSYSSVPIILVGCGSDLRTDRDILTSLSKQGKAPVSVDQALSFCQRIGGVTYVETSAKASARAAISAFEVAGLASMGKIVAKSSENDSFNTNEVLNFDKPGKHHQHIRTKSTDSYDRNSVGLDSAESSLERKGSGRLKGFRGNIYALEPAEQFWEQFNNSLVPSPKISRSISAPRTPSLGSAGSRTASLTSSKTKSNTSIPSIISSNTSPTHVITTKQSTSWLGTKTPRNLRKSSTLSNKSSTQSQGKMIKIRCQRFNTEEKIYEEIEVEVPAPIYETIQVYNETDKISGNNNSRNGKSKSSFNSGRRASFGARLKNLFTPSQTTSV